MAPPERLPVTVNPLPGRQAFIPTPGARVLVRDAEWIVRRVDHAPGGYQMVCDGVSELVRGRGRRTLVLAVIEHADAVSEGILEPAKRPSIGSRRRAAMRTAPPTRRKSHPLVHEWIAASFRDGALSELIPFATLMERTGLGRRDHANSQLPVDVPALSRLPPEAVHGAREHFVGRRDAFEKIINAKLEVEVRALDEFRARRLRRLELDIFQSDQAEHFRRRRDEQVRQEVDDIHDEYWEWIQETMTTEPHPWLRVVCAMTPLAG